MLAALVAASLGAGCDKKRVRRGYEAPTEGEMFTVLQGLQGRAQSFRAETVMDYWLGDDRQKGTVKIMAERGKKMRINALNPAGDSPAMDFACDGTNFQMVDFIKDCQLTGPCDATSVEQFFRIAIEPDAFIDVATGGAPILGEVADATAVSPWDGKQGAERLELTSPTTKQTVWLGGRAHGWAVVRTEVSDAAGKLQWRLDNKDFSKLTAGSQTFYVPAKSWFRAPSEKSDLLIQWESRQVNVEIPDDKFTFEIPDVPMCGTAAGPSTPAK
ncbi:MAG: DUF4292 domain-containing protein [Myxococcales bacterium]|nr:DUF4292 domain-containing protein [Myxococcales bacterium]